MAFLAEPKWMGQPYQECYQQRCEQSIFLGTVLCSSSQTSYPSLPPLPANLSTDGTEYNGKENQITYELLIARLLPIASATKVFVDKLPATREVWMTTG